MSRRRKKRRRHTRDRNFDYERTSRRIETRSILSELQRKLFQKRKRYNQDYRNKIEGEKRRDKLYYDSNQKFKKKLIEKKVTQAKYYLNREELDREREYQEKLRIEKICKERRERRENLFRTGKAGKGKRIRKRKIYDEDSKVRC